MQTETAQRTATDLCISTTSDVRFRMTPAGELAWRRHLETLKLDPAGHPLRRDPAGYVTMPLWEVMHVFGPNTGYGHAGCIERDELLVSADEVRSCGPG
jgi:hypothetical protein